MNVERVDQLPLRDILPSQEVEIIGSGSIGDKARQLVEKGPILKEIGFSLPPRVILAEGFFDSFFQRNRLGSCLQDIKITPDIEQRIRRGSFDLDDNNTLKAISVSFGNSPLMIRSSGEGDARGTGIYKSIPIANRAGFLRKAVQDVLSTYFSEDAIVFRRDAGFVEGFGILIQPVIGQEILSDWGFYFSAPLSGYGYTSTLQGEGYLMAVPGLGCAVEARDGERITKKRFGKSWRTVNGLYSFRKTFGR